MARPSATSPAEPVIVKVPFPLRHGRGGRKFDAPRLAALGVWRA